MAGWYPRFQLLVAFNNAVFDDPALITSVATPAGALGATNVWTDITPWVLDNVDTNRGRQHETDRFQPGTLSCTLLNDGRFDTWNTTSPYTGLVLPGKPCRLRATDPNTAAVDNLFTGVTDVFTPVWDAPRQRRMQLSCVDWFAYMANQNLQANQYAPTVLADSPAMYLRLGDPAGANNAADRSGHNFHSIFFNGTVILGHPGGLPNDMSTAADLAAGSTTPAGDISLNPAGAFTGVSWTFECWYAAGSWASNPNVIYFQKNTAGTGGLTGRGQVGIYVTTGGILTAIHDDGVNPLDNFVSTNPIPADGNFHHIVLVHASGTGTIYLDGVFVNTTVVSGGSPTAVTAVMAAVGSYGSGAMWPGSLQEVALYNTNLSAGQVATHFGAASAPVESSGARIRRVCSWVGIPTANAVIDTGRSQMQTVSGSLTTTAVLSYLQNVEQSEQGVLYIDANGQVRFRSRDWVYTTVNVQHVFGDSGVGGEIPFELGPNIAVDTLDQYIAVTAQRNGGNAQIATSGQLGKVLSLSGLLNTSDAETLGMANWLLGQFSATPKPRIRGVTIHPIVDPTGVATTDMLLMELMDVQTVNRHTLPGAGTAFSQTANVEGLNHHIYPATSDWNVDMQLTPIPPQRPWIWGTSQWSTDTNWFF